MSGALWSSTSASGSPVCEDHIRDSWDSAAEWKVRASTPSTPSNWSRRLSSRAALSVKVTARICDASNAPLRTWHAMRCVIVVVFPVPAPARMATGPRSASAASRWGSFSPARTLSRLCTSRTLAPGSSGGRWDVLIELEQVLRVEPALQPGEAFVLRVAVGGTDARVALVPEEIHVH